MKILKKLYENQSGQTFFEILLALVIISIPVAVYMSGLGEAMGSVLQNLTAQVGKVGS
ncbi:MAG: hypothetical protein ACOY46_09800 [Bacillota bacterium]